MRKKLLALLMCATMVLGSSAVAFAADVTPTDVTNATTVINQYDADKGAVVSEYDAKKSTIAFTTTYDDNTNKVIYTYAFTGTGSGAYVKTSSDGKTPYTKTSGTYGNMTQRSEATRSIVVANLKDSNGSSVANPSANADLIKKAVLKGADGVLYYVSSATVADAGTVVADGQYIIAASADLTDIDVNEDVAAHTLRSAAVVVTLDAFTDGSAPTETGVIVKGSLINAYGIDKDGYIARKDSTVTLLKYSDKIASGYWVDITKASATDKIAQALANGEISTSAVALNIDFYKVEADSDKDTTNETGFKKLTKKKIDKSDIDVKFNTDWLSRSNAKNANTVYVLQSDSANDFEKYFFNYGTVYKVSDLADNSFTTKLIASGTYIFDTVEDASQNDGVSDTDTTATTTAASQTAATSPKTGDVAPIAALAVVMMGACGAMVVASKKRA